MIATRIVGQPVLRTDALFKTTGYTAYAADWEMPNMLHAMVLRSPYPSARIVRIDTGPARAMPGVAAVMTADDLPSSTVVADIPGQTGTKIHRLGAAPVLAEEVVRYKGEPVALVAAERLDIARAALDAIQVEYEPLPVVRDPLEALQPGAPLVAGTDNIIQSYRIIKGDVEQGFAEADLIVENTFRTQHVDHAYLEPEAGVAWVDSNGVLNLRVSTQVIEHFRDIAPVLQIPQSKIRVMGTMIGGGFGGKEDMTVELYISLLALKTRRPVKLVFTREESIQFSTKRHPYIITHKTGVTREGRITADQVTLISDAGAYAYLSAYVLLYSCGTAAGPYRVPNVHIEGKAVATNNPVASAFRGFGAYQAAYAYECQMDEIAHRLGMDPVELRLKNYLTKGDTTASGQTIESEVWLPQTTQRAMEALGRPAPAGPHKRVGRGVASHMTSYGRVTWLHDTSEAWVGVELDGSVVVRAGVPDVGAGEVSAVCQIAAEVVGVRLEDVSIHATDSALTPLAGTTTATRQLYMSGNAVALASRQVRQNLLEVAGREFNLPLEQLDIVDGEVVTREGPERLMSLADLAKRAAAQGVPRENLAMFKAPFTEPLDPETGQGRIWPDFTFGSVAAEVEVDEETGEVRVLKIVGCHDVGKAINPAAVEGQIEGGIIMGLGHALMEDLAVKDGVPQALSFAEYLVPTSDETPEVQAILLESESGLGPFGAKGIGEPALNAVVPAIGNAIRNATGVRVFDLPFTPEKVARTLRGK